MTSRQAGVLILVVLAEAGVLSVWFAAAAGLPSMAAESGRDPAALGGLTVAVQLGFIAGGMLLAFTRWSDRIDKRHLFVIASQMAALSTFLLTFVAIAGPGAHVLRAGTGLALAGVYPVGLSILSDWADRHRALFAGALVGALTVGTAVPHLASLVGAPDWRSIMTGTALLASAAGLLVLGVPQRRRLRDERPHPAVSALGRHLRRRQVRLAIAGYLGHMWELYAFWGWIALALAWSFGRVLPADVAQHRATLVTVAAILAGALASLWAGLAADQHGKALIAKRSVQVSAAAGLLCAATLGVSPALAAALAILWGASVISDSGQYSALVAEETPPHLRTRMLTLVTVLGYAVSAVGLQLTGWIATVGGWPLATAALVPGPVLAAAAMDRLLAPAIAVQPGTFPARLATTIVRTCCR